MLRLFRLKIFFKKNDFSENIFWRLAHTERSQSRKTESSDSGRDPAMSGRRRQISASHIPAVLAGIRPFRLDLAGLRLYCRNPADLAKFQPDPDGIRSIWPDRLESD
jgi:hypothetical protein